jgi:hypothetical protein
MAPPTNCHAWLAKSAGLVYKNQKQKQKQKQNPEAQDCIG